MAVTRFAGGKKNGMTAGPQEKPSNAGSGGIAGDYNKAGKADGRDAKQSGKTLSPTGTINRVGGK